MKHQNSVRKFLVKMEEEENEEEKAATQEVEEKVITEEEQAENCDIEDEEDSQDQDYDDNNEDSDFDDDENRDGMEEESEENSVGSVGYTSQSYCKDCLHIPGISIQDFSFSFPEKVTLKCCQHCQRKAIQRKQIARLFSSDRKSDD